MKKKRFEEHWKEILEWFDFEKVHRTMVALNWTWSTMSGSEIPSIEEIKRTARSLCSDSYENKTNIASGGLWAKYNEKRDELTLEFKVEYWTSKPR